AGPRAGEVGDAPAQAGEDPVAPRAREARAAALAVERVLPAAALQAPAFTGWVRPTFGGGRRRGGHGPQYTSVSRCGLGPPARCGVTLARVAVPATRSQHGSLASFRSRGGRAVSGA